MDALSINNFFNKNKAATIIAAAAAVAVAVIFAALVSALIKRRKNTRNSSDETHAEEHDLSKVEKQTSDNTEPTSQNSSDETHAEEDATIAPKAKEQDLSEVEEQTSDNTEPTSHVINDGNKSNVNNDIQEQKDVCDTNQVAVNSEEIVKEDSVSEVAEQTSDNIEPTSHVITDGNQSTIEQIDTTAASQVSEVSSNSGASASAEKPATKKAAGRQDDSVSKYNERMKKSRESKGGSGNHNASNKAAQRPEQGTNLGVGKDKTTLKSSGKVICRASTTGGRWR